MTASKSNVNVHPLKLTAVGDIDKHSANCCDTNTDRSAAPESVSQSVAIAAE